MHRLLVFFLIICLPLAYASECDDIINKITPEDKVILDRFFRIIVANNPFAYTLFGKKPVSYSGEFIISPWENTIANMPASGIFWLGWDTFKKYCKKHSFKDFLLIREEGRLPIANSIFLINKKEFVKTLQKHKKIFETVLKKEIDPETFLDDIENGKTTFRNSIGGNDALCGILLGYGIHNSCLFFHREIPMKPGYLQYAGSYRRSLLQISSLHYKLDPNHPESAALEKRYSHERGVLSAIYSKGEFFETSLRRLYSENTLTIDDFAAGR